jgi:alkanesulfonate monooxygenase SsuD/methylene tetrahydromethanopterin reductase-like flavin-dependent oxidoreductase (luciferase family)
MNFYFFHLMPYGALDLGLVKEFGSTWTQLPNSNFEPEKGRQLYARYLDELEAAEPLGFDGICVNEHHQTAYGLMPAPSIIAAAMASRTKRVKIAILGHAALLRNNPVTVAEELAMLDHISGGRMICALVRGIGTEYYNQPVNPTYSFERHREAHDIIIRAWTETGPFAYEGKHYHLPYINLWPRPYQQPHPPMWAPSNGSTETVEWAAHAGRKYTYLQAFGNLASSEKYFQLYRRFANEQGWTPTPDKLGWLGPIYVGENDDIALREAKPHIESFFNGFIPKPVQSSFPPGYTSVESLRMIRERHSYIQSGGQTAEGLMKERVFICGGPDTVREQLNVFISRFGVGHILANLQFGTMPHDLTMKNMRMFAREIIPYFKARAAAGTAAAAE